MKLPFTLLGAIAVVLTTGGSILAHHGEANYDTSKEVSVKGAVTSFQFINPHVQIYVDVKDDKGNVQNWVCEATSPNMLVREGWDKNLLKPGDGIAAIGYRAKNGSPTLRLLKIITSDGKEWDHL